MELATRTAYSSHSFHVCDARRKKEVVGKSHSQIEEIIGDELSCGAKAFDHFWTQPSVKRIMSKYNIKFGYINTLTGMIYFEVN